MIESYYIRHTYPLNRTLLVSRVYRRAHFNQDIAQLAERVLGVHEATGSKPVFLTISKE